MDLKQHRNKHGYNLYHRKLNALQLFQNQSDGENISNLQKLPME